MWHRNPKVDQTYKISEMSLEAKNRVQDCYKIVNFLYGREYNFLSEITWSVYDMVLVKNSENIIDIACDTQEVLSRTGNKMKLLQRIRKWGVKIWEG